MAVKNVIEFHGATEVAEALERDAELVIPKVKATTGKALLNIKKGAQQRVSGHPHVPQIGRSYSYDVWVTGAKVIGEAGAEHDRSRQATLDVFLEMGGPRGQAPLPHWAPEAEQESPTWMKYIEAALLEDLE